MDVRTPSPFDLSAEALEIGDTLELISKINSMQAKLQQFSVELPPYTEDLEALAAQLEQLVAGLDAVKLNGKSQGSGDDQVPTNAEVKSNLQIYVPDPLRRSVEDATGGRQTVIYTDKGQPSWMYVLPKFSMEDIPGWASGTGTHPAFIENGVEVSEVMIGVYQGAEVNGEAVSQPGLYPRVNINYDQARALCQASGAGHDLISCWDSAAIALWCMANGYQPRGNTNYGRHHDNRWETGIVPDGATLGSDATGVTNTQCGSGPVGWRHDNTPAGIADLVGNVWEWMTGFKMIDGAACLASDNGGYTEAQYTNTGFSMPSSRTWSTIDAAGAPDSLKQALIVPNGAADPAGYFYSTLTGERLPFRGGTRGGASGAGLAALNLNSERAGAGSSIGFRPRFRKSQSVI